MNFDSVGYILTQALVSLKRNIWLSLASVLTVMVSLTLLGGSVFFLANTSNLASTFESQVEIAVFMNPELETAAVYEIQRQVNSIEGVASVKLTTKDDAIVEFQETMSSASLLEDLGGVNPFPDKLTIAAKEANLVAGIATEVEAIPGVSKVRYGQGVLEKLIVFTQWLRWVGMAVVAVFSFASILLIALNIKTNLTSREREIQIMRLVGASNAFIRWPFLIEGLLVGLIGAALAISVVGLGYNWLLNYIISTLTFIPIVGDPEFIIKVLAMMLASGMFMGAIASIFSIRKFLRV